MARTKKIDYPNLGFEEAIRSVATLIEKLNGSTNSPDAFASLLGHHTAKSGAFIVKIGDLRRYALIEPKGEIVASSLAKKIVHPRPNTNEKQEAVNKAIMSVELWKQLYEKIGKNYPPDSEFWVHIMEATKVDRNEAIKDADKIRKRYKEVMSFYHELGEESSQTTEVAQEAFHASREGGFVTSKSSMSDSNQSLIKRENMIDAKSGDVYIALPKNSKSLGIAKKLLDILSLQIEEEESKPQILPEK